MFEIRHIKTKQEDKKVDIVCPYLKSPPFSWIICGSSFCGKSNFIRAMLIDSNLLKNVFKREHIFLFCGTAKLNKDFADIIDVENTIDGFDEGVIKELLAEQEINIENYGRKNTPNILLIIDDCAYGRALHSDKSMINKLAFNGRHFKTSMIVTSQALMSVSPKTRANVNLITFFCNGNNQEIENFVSTYVPKRFKKRVEDIIYEHAKTPYSFIHLNKTNPIESRLILNLDEPIKFE